MDGFSIQSKSLEETAAFARKVLGYISAEKNTTGATSSVKNATILALSGDLGSGKTAFVKLLAKELGVEEMVTSPTFVIEKIYKLAAQDVPTIPPSFQHLIHIDAYRLESALELVKLGWAEIAANPGNLICIEWPEKVEGLIPKPGTGSTPGSHFLEFTFIDEQTREIKMLQ